MKFNVENIRLISLVSLMFLFSAGLWNKGWYIFDIATKIKWPMLFFCSFLAFFLNNFKLHRIKEIPAYFMLLFLFSISISTFMSPYLNIEGTQFLLGFIFVYFLSFVSPIHDSRSEVIVKSIGYVAIFVVLFSILFINSPDGWGGSRFKGVYDNTNGFGSLAVIAFIYSFIKGLNKKTIFFKMIAAIAFLAIISTQSRGALLGCFSFIIAFCIINRKFKIIFMILILLPSLFFVFNYFVKDSNSDYKSRELEMSLDTARERMLETHIEKFKDKPIFGQGLSIGENGGGRLPSELAYTDILSFSGLIGFLCVLISIFYKLLLNTKNIFLRRIGFYDECAFYIFLAIIMMSLGDGYISNIGNPISIYYWLYLGTINNK